MLADHPAPILAGLLALSAALFALGHHLAHPKEHS